MSSGSVKDWIPTRRQVPSWVLSGLFHAALVWMLLWFAPVWQRPPVGFDDEPSLEIGIFVKERGPQLDPQNGAEAKSVNDAVRDDAPAAADPLTPKQAVPDLPSLATQLPKVETLPAIGPGTLQPGTGIPDPKELIKSSAAGTGAKAAAGGIPGAAFMGAKDHATRVVFVVDASGSMLQHRSMDAAKAALVASISSLEPGQQFQVIFYNETPRTMTLRSAPKKSLYFATDVNKQGARQFIQQIQPDLGTQHLDAIKLGLSFGPEAMFLLTDSGDPLSPKQVAEIARSNSGKTRIHCIEFGVGPELKGAGSNFLAKLAGQNTGTHRYVDVTQFSRR